MRTGPWATLALSATCALLSGGMALLDGPPSAAVRTAAAARPADRLPAAVRSTKADREIVRGGLAAAAFATETLSGTDLQPLGRAAGTAAADPVLGRLVIDGALRQEIEGGLGDEILDDTEGLDDAIAALIAPAEAPQTAARPAIEVPVPPEKPAHAPLTNVPLPPASPNAQRASLFAAAPPAPTKPSRFGFFSHLGVAQQAETKLAALTTPAPDRGGRAPGGVTLPTPFGVPYVLQTEKVDDACLKPQLVDFLRAIERHYGQKVVMTSGERAAGRDGSLHKTCRAADIIVPGVEAEALARYARSLPGMGGVGTYCHPNMIHVDVGSPRDWHYGCGKSYFAVRDGGATALAGRTRTTLTE